MGILCLFDVNWCVEWENYHFTLNKLPFLENYYFIKKGCFFIYLLQHWTFNIFFLLQQITLNQDSNLFSYINNMESFKILYYTAIDTPSTNNTTTILVNWLWSVTRPIRHLFILIIVTKLTQQYLWTSDLWYVHNLFHKTLSGDKSFTYQIYIFHKYSKKIHRTTYIILNYKCL